MQLTRPNRLAEVWRHQRNGVMQLGHRFQHNLLSLKAVRSGVHIIVRGFHEGLMYATDNLGNFFTSTCPFQLRRYSQVKSLILGL